MSVPRHAVMRSRSNDAAAGIVFNPDPMNAIPPAPRFGIYEMSQLQRRISDMVIEKWGGMTNLMSPSY